MTARNANIAANPLPQANTTAYAKAVSWASDLADAILKALGGGGAEVHGGNSKSQTYSNVINDGTIETGIARNQTLILNAGSIGNPVIADPSSTQGISFTVGQSIVNSDLFNELQYDQLQLAHYGPGNQLLHDYYTGEITRITTELLNNGQASYQIANGQTFLVPNGQPVLTATVNPIVADAGSIYVRGDVLNGSGTFISPAGANVTITNHSPAFLNLLGVRSRAVRAACCKRRADPEQR